MGAELFAPMVISLGFFAMITFIVHAVVDGRRRRERIKVMTEFHSRLLDKIGSAQDFGAFLDSGGGSRFLDTLAIDKGSPGPRQRLLVSLQSGIVLLVLGLGLLALGRTYAIEDGVFTTFGVIIGCIGVGLLLSTAAAYRFAGRLGLLDGDGPARVPPAA
jgi:hypothetical protein